MAEGYLMKRPEDFVMPRGRRDSREGTVQAYQGREAQRPEGIQEGDADREEIELREFPRLHEKKRCGDAPLWCRDEEGDGACNLPKPDETARAGVFPSPQARDQGVLRSCVPRKGRVFSRSVPRRGVRTERAFFTLTVRNLDDAASHLAVWLIRTYQVMFSAFLGRCCRFFPTCSSYAILSIQRFGIGVGLWLTVRRLIKCHPFHSGGYDPVPEANRNS